MSITRLSFVYHERGCFIHACKLIVQPLAATAARHIMDP